MIAIVDYDMGNAGSIQSMLKKLQTPSVLSADPDILAAADKLILPGVGAFDHGMQGIADRGLRPALEDARRRGVPILGICLGMQLLFGGSDEGTLPGLSWLPGRCVRFSFEPDADGRRPKVPHMGWNMVEAGSPHPLNDGLEDDARYYFVHSFHATTESADVILWCDYANCRFPAGVARGNVMGVQFHPEKSHRFGLALLRRFVAMPAAALDANGLLIQ